MDETDEQKIEFLVKVIHDIQWKGESVVTPQHRRVGTCPACGAHDLHRHGCRVALALSLKPTPVEEKLEDEPGIEANAASDEPVDPELV